MLSSALVGTDASEASDRVIDCVARRHAIGSRDAVLVHVLDLRDVGGLCLALRRAILPKLEVERQTPEAIHEVFPGSPAHNTARHAPLPALFVPPGQRGAAGPAEEHAS